MSTENDPIRQLINEHQKLLDAGNHYAYFELAYTRQTGWMAWLCSKPKHEDPKRKILAMGQGDTPEQACSQAIASIQEHRIENASRT